jgi:hypothetical protein
VPRPATPAACLRLRPRTASTAAIPASCLGPIPPACGRLRAIPLETLLSAGTVRPGVATRAVIAKGTVAGASIRLLSISSRCVPLGLTATAGTALILAGARSILLIRSGPVLLIRPRPILLITGPGSLTVILGQIPTAILCLVSPIVLKLRRVVFLIELRRGVVGVAPVVVEVICAIVYVVAVDVTNIVSIDAVNVVAVDVVDVSGIDVIPVVVVIAVDERV